MVRGPMVMSHYWQNLAETEQALDGDHWLHTGDTGYFDEADNLIVTGRKQHMIVLSTGRKIARPSSKTPLWPARSSPRPQFLAKANPTSRL